MNSIIDNEGNLLLPNKVLPFDARLTVRKNTGANVGVRRRLNLIEGANVTLTIADDSPSEELDVTIAAAGGGSGDNITINTVALVDANFNDTTPTAPASSLNARWQKDAGSPANVSTNLPYGGSFTVSGGDLQLSGDAASPGNTKLYGTNGSGVKGWYDQPTSGAAVITQTEVDFGATPVAEASFVVVDAAVTATSKIIGSVAYQAPTGKDLDELEMDGLDIKFAPGTGQLTIYARGQDGYVADKFLINYQVAA
jgi:hypothetical protein